MEVINVATVLGFIFYSHVFLVPVGAYSASNVTIDILADVPANAVEIRLLNSNIETIEPNAFQKFGSLYELKMMNCHLKNVSSLAFNGTAIVELKLMRNQLTEFPDLGAIADSLRHLYLDYNGIETVPVSLLSGLQLVTLSVTYNELVQVPDISTMATSIASLSLSHNSITACPAHLLAEAFLEELWLDNNALTSFPNFSLIGSPSPMRVLHLDDNQITFIAQDAFLRFPELLELGLWSNLLTQMPDASPARGLQTLEVGANAISDVGSVLQGLDQLTYLGLGETALQTMPDLRGLVNLREILLWDNQIAAVPSDLKEVLLTMPNLSHLCLIGNPITSFPDMRGLNISLHLDGCPFVCNCSFAWVKEAEMANDAVNVTLSDTPCVQPVGLQEVKWQDITMADICPDKRNQSSTAAVAPTTTTATATTARKTAGIEATASSSQRETSENAEATREATTILLTTPVLTTQTPLQSPVTYMSSVFNDNWGHLAVDGDATTCSLTGLESAPWWKIDMQERVTVEGVVVKMSTIGIEQELEVRVGDHHSRLGNLAGHHGNQLCAVANGNEARLSEERLITCQRPLTGRFLSIAVKNRNEGEFYTRLSLCDVAIE